MRSLIGILWLFSLLASKPVLAMNEEYEPVQNPHVVMHVVNPERDLGYTVGDILSRTVTLEVKKPYLLQETSLPIVGYEKKIKAQAIGIDLREITKEVATTPDKTTYVLHLAYQVFTNNVVAKKAALPAEKVKFIGAGNTVEIRIPSWSFRISPIAVYGAVIVEKDMSPFRGPLQIDPAPEQRRLKVLLAVFGISLLGLLYIHGSNFWLPRMGRPFARAYRNLRKLPANDDGIRQALEYIHQAFNATNGVSVFNSNLESFLIDKPQFVAIRREIERFFNLSASVFFALPDQHGIAGHHLDWLKEFCLKCRHCERGLRNL
jgi:mxaA protein